MSQLQNAACRDYSALVTRTSCGGGGKQLRSELDGKRVTVSAAVLIGNPKQAIVRHAEEFGADFIVRFKM